MANTLKYVTFGRCFNKSLEGVQWPTSLLRLVFGENINQPIAVEGVVWPTSLKHLSFGSDFDQPVAGVVWLASLESLMFGK